MPQPPGYVQPQPSDVTVATPGDNSLFNGGADPYGSESLTSKLEGRARLGFIRKVLGILCVQLTFTALGIVAAVQGGIDYVRFYNRHIELIVIALVVYMVCLYSLGCYKNIARSVPTNYIMLGLFTGAMTYMVSGVVGLYEPYVVMAAGILTAAMTVGLMLYAVFTKEDFTICGGALWILILVGLTASILSIFIRSRVLQIMVSAFLIVLLSFYIIFDMQLIMGNQEQALSIDDYVFGAMMLYIDIMRLFLEILRIFGRK